MSREVCGYHATGGCGANYRLAERSRVWNTMTFIALLGSDRVDAPWLIGGLVNGD